MLSEVRTMEQEKKNKMLGEIFEKIRGLDDRQLTGLWDFLRYANF